MLKKDHLFIFTLIPLHWLACNLFLQLFPDFPLVGIFACLSAFLYLFTSLHLSDNTPAFQPSVNRGCVCVCVHVCLPFCCFVCLFVCYFCYSVCSLFCTAATSQHYKIRLHILPPTCACTVTKFIITSLT